MEGDEGAMLRNSSGQQCAFPFCKVPISCCSHHPDMELDDCQENPSDYLNKTSGCYDIIKNEIDKNQKYMSHAVVPIIVIMVIHFLEFYTNCLLELPYGVIHDAIYILGCYHHHPNYLVMLAVHQFE